MDPWKPVAGLVVAGIAVVAVGSLAALFGWTVVTATPVTDVGTAALAVWMLVVAGVLAVTTIGTWDAGSLATPYW